MVGLFINTVPVRVRIVEGESVHDLLLRVQGDSISGLGHHYVQLADIQSESGFSGALFDHIVVYENYPVQERLESHSLISGCLGPLLWSRRTMVLRLCCPWRYFRGTLSL
ncbi:condensation domain-containing protein [Sphingobacterium sp. ML3W]|uniref:condensation domain-containing protein n=1 Tax=Sphingobacterium sp. ML3W TaxID=1538644 RepID=UPI00300B985A